MSCREQHVKVARTAVVGRDSAVGTGSSLDEGTQVRSTALHGWIRTSNLPAVAIGSCSTYLAANVMCPTDSTEFHS
jgi:hypothetical protein